jgi:tetratricopeptide (TPR) repeat protein
MVMHLGKWAVLLGIGGALFGLELRARAKGPEHEQQILTNLAAWTPNVPELQVRLARQAINDGDPERAIELAREAVRRRPRSHEVHAILANALRHAGKFDEATGYFQTAIDLAPDKWENHLDLGLTLVEMNRLDLAKLSLEQASGLDPTTHTMEHAWGRFYAKKGDFPRMIEHLQAALESNAEALPVRIELVSSLSTVKHYDAAIEIAREGVERSPESADAQVALGRAYIQAKQFRNAIRPLSDAIRIDPNRSDAYFQSGLALVQLGNAKPAIVALRQALSLDADNADAHFQMGNALFLVGDVSNAEDSFQKCFELDPKNFDALSSLGAMLIELEDWDEARAVCRKALELNPNHANSHYNLGLCYHHDNNDEQARLQFQRAWKLGLKPSREIKNAFGLTQPVSTSSGS